MLTKTLEMVEDRIVELLGEHEPQIERAMKNNEGEASVSVRIKLKSLGASGNKVTLSISYTERRTKERDEFVVSEQPELFGVAKAEEASA